MKLSYRFDIYLPLKYKEKLKNRFQQEKIFIAVEEIEIL